MGSKRLNAAIVKEKLKELHPGLVFPNVDSDFTTTDSRTTVLCEKHGEFSSTFDNLLYAKSGCKRCSVTKVNEIVNLRLFKDIPGSEKVLSRFSQKYPDKRYYRKSEIELICTIHGDFTGNIKTLINGAGCPKCKNPPYNKKSLPEIIEKISGIHKDKYKVVSVCEDTRRIVMGCTKHGEWDVSYGNLTTNKTGCPKCSTQVSKEEFALYQYIKSIKPDAISQHRIDGLNIDIFIPSMSLAIEYNGTYFHSTKFKDKYSHRDRRRKLEAMGIRSVMIWEYEDRERVRRYIDHLLGNSTPIYARKCTIEEVTFEEGGQFIERNHLMGSGLRSKIYLAIKHKETVVGVVGFRKVFNRYELYRAAYLSGFRVIGGLSKVISYYRKNISTQELISYVDLDKFDGKSYFKAGFIPCKESVSLSYVKGDSIISRHLLKKSKLKSLPYYNDLLTEVEILAKNKIYPCYSSGTLKVLLV